MSQITDKELSLRLSVFMENLVNSGDVDNITMITNRGDHVGVHTNGKNGASEAVAFVMIEQVSQNKSKFRGTINSQGVNS